MFSQYGELRPTNGWDLLATLGHPCNFQRVSRLGSVTARHSSSARQPNFAALNRGRHLCLAGQPSRWALAHISSVVNFVRWWWTLSRQTGRRVCVCVCWDVAVDTSSLLGVVLSAGWLCSVQIWVQMTIVLTTSRFSSEVKSVCGQSLPTMTVSRRDSGQLPFDVYF